MKNILKLTLLLVFAVSLIFAVAIVSSANEDATPSLEVIVVGESTDSEGNAYTLDSAWAYQAEATHEVEVVVKTGNADFVTNFGAVNKSNKKTVLQLTENVSFSTNVTLSEKAHIIVDVSGFTFTSEAKIALYNVNSILTFRTTTAAGKVYGNKWDTGFVRLDQCRNNTSHCTLEFLGANNSDKALTYEGAELVQMEGDARGYQKVVMKNFIYNGTKALLHGRKAPGNANPAYVQIDATDSVFYLTPGEGFLWHDTVQCGLISLGSYLKVNNCQFISKTSGKTTQFFYHNGGNMLGRWYMDVQFNGCDFTEIGLNMESIYSYSIASTDETGAVIYDTNYPSTANPTDYYVTVANSEWDATKQVTFVGNNTFTSCTGINETYDGFTAVNAKANNKVNQFFYSSSTLYHYGDEVDNSADLLKLIALANENTSKKVIARLSADITLPEGAAGRTSIFGNIEIDLAGHTLTLGTAQNWTRGTLAVYSSEKGGVLLSHSSNTMFQLDVKGKPNLTFGREEYPIENLTVKSTSSSGQGGIAIFCSDFEGKSATLTFYNCKIETAKYLIKLNSKANSATYPELHTTFKGCDIFVSYCGILTYNENDPIAYATQSGLFKEGSFVNVEDCGIYASTGSALFYTSEGIQKEGDTVKQPNFAGRFFAIVTFKNTDFVNIHLNQDMIASSKDNLAQNSLNASYTVSDTWDVAKQVTFMEGCTFKMGDKAGINANGNGFVASNSAVADGYVLARTEQADTFAILPESECVAITWQLPEKAFTVYYKTGVALYTPTLPAAETLNGNTYTPEYDTTPAATATENKVYMVKWTGGAKFSANYTLEVAIDFFVYVPVSEEITHINGVAVADLEKITLDNGVYYKVSFENLAPKNAYKSQCVSLTVALEENTVKVDRYVSVIGYAKAALASDFSTELKALVLATLDYINKTNVYFGGESVAQIEAILDANAFTPYTWTASNVKEQASYKNVKFAALDLDKTPGFVFVVNKDYEGVLVVNGKTYDTFIPTEIQGVEYKYTVVEIPAHSLAKDLNVVCGEDNFVFNLDTYIATEAPDAAYAHALYGYVLASIAYNYK